MFHFVICYAGRVILSSVLDDLAANPRFVAADTVCVYTYPMQFTQST